jgi:hypothetical protein
MKLICIPSSVEVLGTSSFFDSVIESIGFESNSHLRRIGVWWFEHYSLQAIWIPVSVEVLEKSCFSPLLIGSMTFGLNLSQCKLKNPVLGNFHYNSFLFFVPLTNHALLTQRLQLWHLRGSPNSWELSIWHFHTRPSVILSWQPFSWSAASHFIKWE